MTLRFAVYLFCASACFCGIAMAGKEIEFDSNITSFTKMPLFMYQFIR